MPYEDGCNPELLEFIPPDAKVVLEIGCAAGRLAQAYRLRNPGVTWDGFDIDREAIGQAKQPGRCTTAWEVDVEREDIFDFPWDANSSADVLIFGDVLEHLHDPWTLLKRLAKDLAPGCQILASIPNVQHWTVIRDLMAGRWRYTDAGLLDRDHLRFFTLEGIYEIFEQAKLEIRIVKGKQLANEEYDRWIEQTGINPGGIDPHCLRVYQWIVQAVKPIKLSPTLIVR